MKTSKIVEYKGNKYCIEVEIENLDEGRLVAKSPKTSIKPKTPISKVKNVKNSDETKRPNTVKS